MACRSRRAVDAYDLGGLVGALAPLPADDLAILVGLRARQLRAPDWAGVAASNAKRANSPWGSSPLQITERIDWSRLSARRRVQPGVASNPNGTTERGMSSSTRTVATSRSLGTSTVNSTGSDGATRAGVTWTWP